MKGIVFNLLETIVGQEHGEDVWDDLLEQSGLEGAYTSLGSYPDEDFMKIVGAASQELGLPPDDVVRWFGTMALPLMAKKYPRLMEGHQGTRTFLLALNDIIHPEVRKLYPGANVPVFDYEETSEHELVMRYSSPRQLCALAEGLTLGAADHFGERVSFQHEKCTKRGDRKCIFRISFQGAK